MQVEIYGVKYDKKIAKELLDDEKKELVRLEKALHKAKSVKSVKQASQLNLKCFETKRTIDYLEKALLGKGMQNAKI